MAIQDNSPTFSYVKIDGISVIWNNEIFMVQDFATNKKYVYWNADVPHQLNASNTMPNRSTVQHLVLINDNGISTIVPPTDENFSISFDGNSEQVIKEKIFGLYAKNEEFGEKFVAIEQNIDGLKQIVGESGGSDSTLWEKVSQIEQKSDEISIAVKENKKEYDDNKETSQLREDLNTSIIQINSILGVFKSEITGYFKDNEISQEESEKIKVQLELLENAKSDFDGSIDKVILIAEENGQSQDVIALSSAKQSLNNIHNNLKNNIENSIIDSIITTTEITIVIDSFAKYNLKVNEIKNTCDNIIILGMGGVITEELARIDVKSDEIKLSVSKVESDFKNEMSLQKIEFEKQIGDVSSALNEFENTVNTVFKDGIVDEAEKQILMEKIANIDKEKIDVDSRFLAIVNDENLSEEIKADLIDKYDNFNTKYDNLKEKINQVISDDMVNDAEKLEVNTLFKQYANAISSFTASVNKAIENIAFNSSKAELEQTKNELKNEINDVNGAISGLEDTMNGAFLDGVLSEAEKLSIKQHLLTLSSEKCDIDKQYVAINSSEYLDGEHKTNLVNSYNNYINSYNGLISTINTILEKNTIIDSIDRNNLDTAFENHNRDLGIYTECAIKALDYISQKKAEAESEKVDKKYAEIILDPETGIISKVEHINTKIDGEGGLEQRLQSAEEKITPDGISQTVMNSQFIKDMQTGITTNSQNISKIDQKADSISFEVSKKVGNDSIISAINQTAEAIRISASKVNLNGYVTFSELGDYVTEDDLGKYGTTTIHGDRIETGSIKVNQLSSNNENPIIKLFDNCSIDATSKNEQGKGNAIRLKMDNENYIKVTQSGYGVNGDYVGAHTAIFSSLYPNHEVMMFQGNAHWGKIWTTQGIISTHGDNVYYGRNGDTTDKRLAKATEVDSVSKTANNALSKADSAYNKAVSAYDVGNHSHPYASSSHSHSNYLPTAGSSYFESGSHDPYSMDKYNLGWSSARWQQLASKYVYATNTYSLAIDNPVATISDDTLDDVLDDVIIESPNIMRMSDDNGMNEKLVINVNALKQNRNAHLFVGKDDGGKTVVNESSLLALALLEIQKLKQEIKTMKEGV